MKLIKGEKSMRIKGIEIVHDENNAKSFNYYFSRG